MVRDGRIHTPPVGNSVLPGITRDCVLALARDLEIPIVETIVPRESLYIADEVFFSGTAAEITPIRSIDRITIGQGRRGPVTERLQKEFFAVINGQRPDQYGWLSQVYSGQPVAALPRWAGFVWEQGPRPKLSCKVTTPLQATPTTCWLSDAASTK